MSTSARSGMAVHLSAINAYRSMDIGELATLAYRMERTLRAIQLGKVQNLAILAGEVVAQAIAIRSGHNG